jgi:hypothetical protein
MSRIIHLPGHTRLIRQRYDDDIPFAKKFTDVHLPDQTPMLRFQNWSAKAKSSFRGLVRQCDITELSVRKNVPNYPFTGPHATYSATLCRRHPVCKKVHRCPLAGPDPDVACRTGVAENGQSFTFQRLRPEMLLCTIEIPA